MSEKKSALFVCLGNICRSPIAEAVFKHLIEEQGIENQWNVVDSAATSTYQIGNPPYDLGQKCMKKYNTYHHVQKHRARQITAKDYEKFDYIFGMDANNMSDLKQMAPKGSKAKILQLGKFDSDRSHNGIIVDPYYNDDEKDFDTVYHQCMRSCKGFLNSI